MRALTLVAATTSAIALAMPVDAQIESREYAIKAAFLVNFLRLTEWPEGDTSSHRTICVLGESPFGSELSALDGTVAGGGIVETRVDVDISEVATCNVLFISSSEVRSMSSVLEALARSSILTVAEMRGFAASGGMLEMRVDRNRISLELNVTAVQESGLFVKSQLLRLARTVR